MALSGDGDVLVGECRWGSVSSRDLETFQRRAARVVGELKNVRRVTLALFAGRGLADDAVKARVAAGEALFFSLEDRYEDVPVQHSRAPGERAGSTEGNSGRPLPAV